MKQGDLVILDWVDSVTPENQCWIQLEDVEMNTHGCTSVGFVAEVTRQHVTLVQTHDNITGAVNGVITIPRVAITGDPVVIDVVVSMEK